MGEGLWNQLEGKFIHEYEKKAISDFAIDLERMLIFGEKRTKIMKMQEDAMRIVTTYIQNGRITIYEMLRLEKLIKTDDIENINLALHILNTK